MRIIQRIKNKLRYPRPVQVALTNGFGNNLFQYFAASLIADFHNRPLEIRCNENYYGLEGLKGLGLQVKLQKRLYKDIIINDENHHAAFESIKKSRGIYVKGYFEDYRHFLDSRDKLKKMLPPFTVQKGTLGIHLRTGDRLLMKNVQRGTQWQSWKQAIDQFDFEKMIIITDMPFWREITTEDVVNFKFHADVPAENRASPRASVDYFNNLFRGFDQYNPEVQSNSVHEDFQTLQSCESILFEHGTLSWWAAFLSDAKKVGVYGPWRHGKGMGNRNLSHVPLNNWFQWE